MGRSNRELGVSNRIRDLVNKGLWLTTQIPIAILLKQKRPFSEGLCFFGAASCSLEIFFYMGIRVDNKGR